MFTVTGCDRFVAAGSPGVHDAAAAADKKGQKNPDKKRPCCSTKKMRRPHAETTDTQFTPQKMPLTLCRLEFTQIRTATRSWAWIGSIHGLDWVELGGMTVTPVFLISNRCSTVDAVSFKF